MSFCKSITRRHLGKQLYKYKDCIAYSAYHKEGSPRNVAIYSSNFNG
jgi:hypothetical protein